MNESSFHCCLCVCVCHTGHDERARLNWTLRSSHTDRHEQLVSMRREREWLLLFVVIIWTDIKRSKMWLRWSSYYYFLFVETERERPRLPHAIMLNELRQPIFYWRWCFSSNQQHECVCECTRSAINNNRHNCLMVSMLRVSARVCVCGVCTVYGCECCKYPFCDFCG